MFEQKLRKYRAITLADFPEHPASGFVHQVVRMEQKTFSQPERRGKLAVPDQRQRGNHGDSLIPEIRTSGQAIKHIVFLAQRCFTDDAGGAQVHQVPVVDVLGVLEIDLEDLLTQWLITFSIMFDQNQQGTQADFVVRIFQQFYRFRYWQFSFSA